MSSKHCKTDTSKSALSKTDKRTAAVYIWEQGAHVRLWGLPERPGKVDPVTTVYSCRDIECTNGRLGKHAVANLIDLHCKRAFLGPILSIARGCCTTQEAGAVEGTLCRDFRGASSHLLVLLDRSDPGATGGERQPRLTCQTLKHPLVNQAQPFASFVSEYMWRHLSYTAEDRADQTQVESGRKHTIKVQSTVEFPL